MNDLPQEIREQLAITNLNSPNIKQQKEADLVNLLNAFFQIDILSTKNHEIESVRTNGYCLYKKK